MVRQKRKKSDANDIGTPAMIHVAVNKNREETKSTIGSEVTYDAADLKPLGRSAADTPALNTRNESIRLGTWNVRMLNHAGNMDNLT